MPAVFSAHVFHLLLHFITALLSVTSNKLHKSFLWTLMRKLKDIHSASLTDVDFVCLSLAKSRRMKDFKKRRVFFSVMLILKKKLVSVISKIFLNPQLPALRRSSSAEHQPRLFRPVQTPMAKFSAHSLTHYTIYSTRPRPPTHFFLFCHTHTHTH